MILPLVRQGLLLKRYKRFFMDVITESSSEPITAHCPNPGTMLGVLEPHNPVLLTFSSNPKRKLAYTVQAIKVGETWVGANPSLANELVNKALTMRSLPAFHPYSVIEREKRYGTNSRIDFLLKGENLADCYIEVKNVHLRRQEAAEFPDCVTARGTKHLNELAALAQQGYRCVLLYVIQRDDTKGFKIAADLDPVYAEATREALEKGVETMILIYSLQLTQNSLHFTLKEIR